VEAHAAHQEALSLRRVLAASNPAYRGDLALSLNNLGVSLRDLGRYEEVLAAHQEALSLRRALAADNPAYIGDLALSLNNLSNSLRDLGRAEEALTAAEEAVSLRRALAPANPAYRGDLAMSLNILGARMLRICHGPRSGRAYAEWPPPRRPAAAQCLLRRALEQEELTRTLTV
jgi:tetratricopeptide (TPR) repeat protein